MKKFIITSLMTAAALMLFNSCADDFLDVNVDPKAASLEQVQIEYFINASITGAQMNPHDAERAFVLYWKTAGRQHRANGSLALGAYSDDWSNDYYGSLSNWLKTANFGVSVGYQKIEEGVALPYTSNLLQVARIWRAYLMSEFTDNFGPMPIDGFSGVNPTFASEKDAYYFMLAELKEATEAIDPALAVPENIEKFDKAYGFDFEKWQKYGNSMRMRLAMRLSEADPQKARSEFEDAASKAFGYISNAQEIFKVQETGGWNDLTAVMSREWNAQMLSSTLNNLYIGLGGISSTQQLPEEMHEYVKPADYMGLRYEEHFGTITNDPSAGYWLDGLPQHIDPRAYKAFIIPGWFTNPNFSFYPSWDNTSREVNRKLLKVEGLMDEDEEIDATFHWNALCLGNWGPKASRNQMIWAGTMPRLSQRFREGNNHRIFFADWESYFLLAEAAVRGWNVPVSAKEAYENGIRASFRYWGVDEFATHYLQSESYNRAGTSVSWDHTAEPPASVSVSYINGYTKEEGTAQMVFPNNTIYKNGTVKNDALTKIITQKYLAQLPYLPLETWNDHRRLGLPFFENPSMELPLTNMPWLTDANVMSNQINFFPQRLKYPSRLPGSNPAGYQEAVGHLSGPDDVFTPLWWAQKP